MTHHSQKITNVFKAQICKLETSVSCAAIPEKVSEYHPQPKLFICILKFPGIVIFHNNARADFLF